MGRQKMEGTRKSVISKRQVYVYFPQKSQSVLGQKKAVPKVNSWSSPEGFPLGYFTIR